MFFITAAAKSFPIPLVLSRLSPFHPCFYSSGQRCWTSLTSEMKGDLFFPLSTLIKRQQQEHQSILTRTVLQTGDRLQGTCKMSHDYADMRHIMCLRLFFFPEICRLLTTMWISLGQLLKCKDWLCLWVQAHSTWHEEPWRWLLLLIAKAGMDIPAEQSLAVTGFFPGSIAGSRFCLQKTHAGKTVLSNHQTFVFHTFANSHWRPWTMINNRGKWIAGILYLSQPSF